MGFFDFFKSKDTSANQQNEDPTFDPNTLTMVQPGSTQNMNMNANANNAVVSEQPTRQEQMEPNMQLRGGGGGFCCGICAGLACFECCEICC